MYRYTDIAGNIEIRSDGMHRLHTRGAHPEGRIEGLVESQIFFFGRAEKERDTPELNLINA